MSDIYCDCKVGICEGRESERCAFKHVRASQDVTDVQITNEMLNAGINSVSADDWCSEDFEAIVKAVYKAMCSAALNTGRARDDH